MRRITQYYPTVAPSPFPRNSAPISTVQQKQENRNRVMETVVAPSSVVVVNESPETQPAKRKRKRKRAVAGVVQGNSPQRPALDESDEDLLAVSPLSRAFKPDAEPVTNSGWRGTAEDISELDGPTYKQPGGFIIDLDLKLQEQDKENELLPNSRNMSVRENAVIKKRRRRKRHGSQRRQRRGRNNNLKGGLSLEAIAKYVTPFFAPPIRKTIQISNIEDLELQSVTPGRNESAIPQLDYSDIKISPKRNLQRKVSARTLRLPSFRPPPMVSTRSILPEAPIVISTEGYFNDGAAIQKSQDVCCIGFWYGLCFVLFVGVVSVGILLAIEFFSGENIF